MLKRLDIENFTVFERASFDLGPHINVIHGTNGTGKSHALKLAYVIQHALATPPAAAAAEPPSKSALDRAIADELVEVFRPDGLGRLTTRTHGRASSKIGAAFDDARHDLTFGFSTASKTEVKVENTPRAWMTQRPIYLPTREALTIYPGFAASTEITRSRWTGPGST